MYWSKVIRPITVFFVFCPSFRLLDIRWTKSSRVFFFAIMKDSKKNFLRGSTSYSPDWCTEFIPIMSSLPSWNFLCSIPLLSRIRNNPMLLWANLNINFSALSTLLYSFSVDFFWQNDLISILSLILFHTLYFRLDRL